ncbi:v-type proton ATPase subunit H [Caerostris extrusa]|uniref:V-type proton ATPase subunit H n=1 Tax=Caerostris extrusa TaxID=172846 RepID=A0AAV4PIM1_CAEEX|nr:v-type proton ATPase subunit H [Caerostris extrusa]
MEQEAMQTFVMLSENVEQKVWDIAGKLWRKSKKIREEPPIDWLPYLENRFINQKEFSFVNAFQYTKTKEERDLIITYFKDSAFKTIVKVVQCVYVVKEIEKFLILLDDFVVEDMSRIKHFNEEVEEPWKAFIHLLHCSNNFVRNIASRIITKLMVGHKIKRPSSRQTEFFLEWLKTEMNEENKYLLSVSRCLQRLLQVDDYRLSFMNMSGIVQIINLLTTGIKPQAQYQFCFCLWVTTFNSQLAAELEEYAIL